jgi:hypothetical protein
MRLAAGLWPRWSVTQAPMSQGHDFLSLLTAGACDDAFQMTYGSQRHGTRDI